MSRAGKTRLLGAGWRAGPGDFQTHPAPMHPGLPDAPGELHRAVIGRGAAPQGVESSGHTDVPGEAPPHPASQVVQISALLLTTSVPSGVI